MITFHKFPFLISHHIVGGGLPPTGFEDPRVPHRTRFVRFETLCWHRFGIFFVLLILGLFFQFLGWMSGGRSPLFGPRNSLLSIRVTSRNKGTTSEDRPQSVHRLQNFLTYLCSVWMKYNRWDRKRYPLSIRPRVDRGTKESPTIWRGQEFTNYPHAARRHSFSR